jgi:hypothetical protein
VVEHRAKNCIKRKLRMQQHRRFKQKVDPAETPRRGVTGGDALYLRKEVIDSGVRSRGAKDNLVRAINAKSNDVAVFHGMFNNFLAIKEDAAALAAIFKAVTAVEQECSRAAGDSGIGQLELISSSAATSDEERRLSDANRATRRIGSNNFQDRVADGQVVRHECPRDRILARSGRVQKRCLSQQIGRPQLAIMV